MDTRFDSLTNVVTGLGNPQRDPTTQYSIGTNSVSLHSEQQASLATHGLLYKVIHSLPKNATRKWGTVTLQDGDPDLANQINKALNNLPVIDGQGIRSQGGFKRAFQIGLGNAFETGNGAIIPDVEEDGVSDEEARDLRRPLDPQKIKSIRGLHVVSQWELRPDLTRLGVGREYEYYTRIESGLLGLGEIGAGQQIHRSRVYWLRGIEQYRYTTSGFNNGYSGQGCDRSILDLVVEPFLAYYHAVKGAEKMMMDFDVVVHKIKDLADSVRDDCEAGKSETEETIRRRIQLNQMMRSVFRALVIDKDGEEIAHDTRPVSGYDSLIKVLENYLQISTPYPPSILLGRYSSGLGSAGEGQLERQEWNEEVSNFQEEKIAPHMTGDIYENDVPPILQLVCLAKSGPTKGDVPEGLGWKFHPLFDTTPKDQAELEEMRAAIVTQYATLDPRFTAQAVLSHYGGDDFQPEVTLTKEYKDELKKEAELKQKPPEPQPPEGGNDFGGFEGGPQQDSTDIHQDDNTSACRYLPFHGWTIGVQYKPFDIRHGKVLPVGYGHIQKTKGEDGMAVDCYIGNFLDSERIWRVAQLTKEGEFDEYKLFIGFRSSEQEIVDLYQSIMPPEFFGGIEQITLADLEQYRSATLTKVDAIKPREDAINPLARRNARNALQQLRKLSRKQRKALGLTRQHIEIANTLRAGKSLSDSQEGIIAAAKRKGASGVLLGLLGG